jgi:hypothetical protein
LMMKATFDDESNSLLMMMMMILAQICTFWWWKATSFDDDENNYFDLIYSLLYYKISFIIACFRVRVAMNINKTWMNTTTCCIFFLFFLNVVFDLLLFPPPPSFFFCLNVVFAPLFVPMCVLCTHFDPNRVYCVHFMFIFCFILAANRTNRPNLTKK